MIRLRLISGCRAGLRRGLRGLFQALSGGFLSRYGDGFCGGAVALILRGWREKLGLRLSGSLTGLSCRVRRVLLGDQAFTRLRNF